MRFDFAFRAPQPRAQITDEERALIDAAVAAGRVRPVPIGASGRPQLVWSEMQRRIVEVRDGHYRAHNKHNIAVADAAAKTSKAVIEMKDSGKSTAEIAAALNVSASCVNGHIRRHRDFCEAEKSGG